MELMVVAGEASGDKHAAKLVAALHAMASDFKLEFFGCGGDAMRAAGVETIVDSSDLSIMGALEVASALPKFLSVFRLLREAARDRKPRLVILVDWPEFNLRLAKRLNRDGHRVIYYISPQIWAWRSYRINTIKSHVNKMLVILPFERDYYQQHGIEVDYVGHPLLDSVHITESRDSFRSRHGLDRSRPVIALLPGSRHSELKYIFPPLAEAASLLGRSHPELQFLMPLAGTFNTAKVSETFGKPANIKIVENETYNALAASDLAVVASGTATLETAIIGTPMIIVYRASSLNWRIFRPMINVPFVGMPNLIAGREIAPELLQNQLNPQRLADQILTMINDPDLLEQRRSEMNEVRLKLGESRASERAALKIAELLDKGVIHEEIEEAPGNPVS